MPEVVKAMVSRLADYQATAVAPVKGEGCTPVINKRGAWRPCDAPDVLAHGYDTKRTESWHAARQSESGYQLSGTDRNGRRFASFENEP